MHDITDAQVAAAAAASAITSLLLFIYAFYQPPNAIQHASWKRPDATRLCPCLFCLVCGIIFGVLFWWARATADVLPYAPGLFAAWEGVSLLSVNISQVFQELCCP
jgi:hypothetical protein